MHVVRDVSNAGSKGSPYCRQTHSVITWNSCFAMRKNWTKRTAQLRTGNPGRQYKLASLNRAVVIATVSAWESNVEQLVRESVFALRPAGPPFADPWPALNAYVTGRLGRFNTPNQHNVEELIRSCLGLSNVHHTWTWRNCTSVQAVQRLDGAMDFRHRIAHGVNPRPTVHNLYSSKLPEFVRAARAMHR